MCMWRPETQVPLREQGACCEQRPAALKHRSPVQPDSQLWSSLPCQATPQPAGSNLQLQHLSRINSSAPTLKASRCTRGRGAGGALVPVDKAWLVSKGNKIVLLIYCCLHFCSPLYVQVLWVMEQRMKNNGAFITAFKNDGCAGCSVKTVYVLIFH